MIPMSPKKALLIGISYALLAFAPQAGALCFFGEGSDCVNTQQVPYCTNGQNCSIESGVSIVKNNINDIEKQRPLSVYIQDIAAYLLYFVAIVGVLYIIYAGFLILTAHGKDDQVKKARTMIVHVLIGIVVMFLAFSIVRFTLRVLSTSTAFVTPSFIEQANAVDAGLSTFDDYSREIQMLEPQIEREYKDLNKLN